MMEGGNIDWASHANDGATVIREVMNFQKAIDVAYRFYLAHPDETLIVVTADHDTGGMALGRRGTKVPDLSLVDFQRISKDRFSDYCKSLIAGGEEPSWDSMKTFLTENTGLWGAVALTDEETARLRDSFEAAMLSRKSADEKGLYNSFNRFSVDVFDMINSKYGIGRIAYRQPGAALRGGPRCDAFYQGSRQYRNPATHTQSCGNRFFQSVMAMKLPPMSKTYTSGSSISTSISTVRPRLSKSIDSTRPATPSFSRRR